MSMKSKSRRPKTAEQSDVAEPDTAENAPTKSKTAEPRTKTGRPRKNPYARQGDGILECGIKVNITRRPKSPFWQMTAFVKKPGKDGDLVTVGVSKSSKTKDYDMACMAAREWAARLANDTVGVASNFVHLLKAKVANGYIPTIGECVTVYEDVELNDKERWNTSPRFMASRWSDTEAIKQCAPLGLLVCDITPQFISSYASKRRAGGFYTKGPLGNEEYHGPGAENATILGDFNTLGRIINVALSATRYRSKQFVAQNPMHTPEIKAVLPPKGKQKRPVAAIERLDKMYAAIPLVEKNMDSKVIPGMLETIMRGAEYNGRRIGAQQGLRIGSILDTPEKVRTWIMHNSQEGLTPEFADFWPHGAIVYTDTEVIDRRRVGEKRPGETALIIPMSERQKHLYSKYIATHPLKDDQNAWLFPWPHDLSKPITGQLLNQWFLAMEKYAGLEHIDRDGYHGLRRGLRSKLPTTIFDKELVNLVMGWKTVGKDKDIGMSVYMQYGPQAIYEVMAFDPRTYFSTETGRIPGVNVDVLRSKDPRVHTDALSADEVRALREMVAKQAEELEALRRREQMRVS